ncbi:WD40 repeat-like protein [Phellopilus nigrolimitatus]|nr:WD40 repeat-like protein [Phellopilus nigrolimitatus]
MHAPSPSHILRVHASHVNVVSFSADNEPRTLRSIAAWKAHTDSILGVQEWESSIVTHGRDNKLHVWALVLAPHSVGDAASSPDLPTPALRYSLDVNALNFCRFSILPLAFSEARSSASSVYRVGADVWELSSCKRVHAAVGKLEAPEIGMKGWEPDRDGRGQAKTGILMSLHLFLRSSQLHLVSAYESGEVALRRYTDADREMSIEGRGWECIWKTKEHRESVMGMAVSPDCSFALTVSADHIVARYDLFTNKDEGKRERFAKFRIRQAGNSAISLRSDGRICAVGGWDGKIRLFSTKSFKSLGTLSYHAKSCQALAFAHSSTRSACSNATVDGDGSEDEDDELTNEEKEGRSRWLAAGAQDTRLTVWELMNFDKNKEYPRP